LERFLRVLRLLLELIFMAINIAPLVRQFRLQSLFRIEFLLILRLLQVALPLWLILLGARIFSGSRKTSQMLLMPGLIYTQTNIALLARLLQRPKRRTELLT
jgi:hypothetical protein